MVRVNGCLRNNVRPFVKRKKLERPFYGSCAGQHNLPGGSYKGCVSMRFSYLL